MYDSATWDPVFEEVAPRYGLDPDLLKAIAMQENVNPAYNNPLGRSSDAGVHHYTTPEEGRAAIEHQVQLLTDPNGYYKDFVKTGSIADLAKVYSPVGASNDPYRTNATEGSGIAAALARLKGGGFGAYTYSSVPIRVAPTSQAATTSQSAPTESSVSEEPADYAQKRKKREEPSQAEPPEPPQFKPAELPEPPRFEPLEPVERTILPRVQRTEHAFAERHPAQEDDMMEVNQWLDEVDHL